MLDNIGKKIRKAREELGVSQKDLGMTLGLSDKAISAYESARTVPPLETLIRIADELNKPIDFFIKDGASDFSIETQLASMDKCVSKLLTEIKQIRELIENQDESQSTVDDQSQEFVEPTQE